LNYYNEFDPDAAQWLRNLITAGLIPAGDVDERSIEDVRPNDLRGYTQCHFFAGIGGWPLALDLAGWPRDMPAWTGSCPCQPFSSAGKGDGFADERHLWPAWFHLIRECRPNVVFGEQVASAIRHGWLDLVSADLEAEGYAVGGAVLGAHSVGALHGRQRLYWVGANADSFRPQRIEREHGEVRKAWRPEQFARLVQDELRVSIPSGKHGALSDGIPNRLVRLRAYGNAIVPQTAAEFIRAFVEQCQHERLMTRLQGQTGTRGIADLDTFG
jgi:DNA (cytosine-5)-methyltransferase 1